MKRAASPAIPEGATQAKSEPPSCNGHSTIVSVEPRSSIILEPSSNPGLATSMEVEDCTPSTHHNSVVNGNGTANIHKHSTKISTSSNMEEHVAILDFGAQFGKVIDRRIREHNVMSEILPLDTKAADLVAAGFYRAIIISGGPSSVYAPDAPKFDPEIFTCGIPVLGICYGFQLLNKALGGGVVKESIRDDGQMEVNVETTSCLFDGLQSPQKVLLTHGDSVTAATVAKDVKIIAHCNHLVAGIALEERKLYGVQFHPEVDLSLNGKKMLGNFLFKVAGCKGGYTMGNREQMCIDEIRSTVRNMKVLVLVSGGVDSTVCAALLHKALGKDRVIAIHIDNGFMRYHESDKVIESLNKLNLNVHRFNSHFTFLNSRIVPDDPESPSLSTVVAPEAKRKIIGDTFMRVKDSAMRELKLSADDIILGQGTLRPDLIESASSLVSGHADTIKTHHNDTSLVRELRIRGRVIEPLKDFHKDEVRTLGLSLGLPADIVMRHPFPGPGLAIRIICAEEPYICEQFQSTQRKLHCIANLAQNIGDEEMSEIRYQLSKKEIAQLSDHKFEISTTLLPIKSVGVQGDGRTYSYVAALSTSLRPIPWPTLKLLASSIPRLLHNINRVVYVFGDRVRYPVMDITKTHLNAGTISKLQWADRLATDALCGLSESGKPDVSLENCINRVQQMPVVMIPIHFDRDPSDRKFSVLHSFVLRPFITNDFMTGLAAIPGEDIPEKTVFEMQRRIMANVPLTSRVLLDLTSKPPGTTEWE